MCVTVLLFKLLLIFPVIFIWGSSFSCSWICCWIWNLSDLILGSCPNFIQACLEWYRWSSSQQFCTYLFMGADWSREEDIAYKKLMGDTDDSDTDTELQPKTSTQVAIACVSNTAMLCNCQPGKDKSVPTSNPLIPSSTSFLLCRSLSSWWKLCCTLQALGSTKPLQWFGGLVSPHLRAAQSSFESGFLPQHYYAHQHSQIQESQK